MIGFHYHQRFELLGQSSDLDMEIDYFQQTVSFTPDEDDAKPGRLCNLGTSHQTRFNCLRQIEDLETALGYKSRAVQLAHDQHPNKPALLGDLGGTYGCRFANLGQISDLDKAIEFTKQALQLVSEDSPEKPQFLANLGTFYQGRFNDMHLPPDLDAVINCRGQLVMLTPDEHPDKPIMLANLRDSLNHRFNRLGQLSDLDMIIDYNSQAVSLTPDGQPPKPAMLNALGVSYERRFSRLGNMSDLDSAINCFNRAASLTQDGDSDKAESLNLLGRSYNLRFHRTGNLQDLETAINFFNQALSLTPDGDPLGLSLLGHLGAAYSDRFDRLGELGDLDRAIDYKARAVLLTPSGHIDKPTWLSNLGISCHSRFERLGQLADLEKAIECLNEAVSLTPEAHPAYRPGMLDNLSTAYLSRFMRSGHKSDLNLAVQCMKESVSLTPDGHPEMPRLLNGLGVAYHLLFTHLGQPSDLDLAVDCLRQAVDILPEDHPNKPIQCSNLGNCYMARFQHLAEPRGLNMAVDCLRQAAELIREGHSERPKILALLGRSYHARFDHSGASADISASVECYKQAAQSVAGSPMTRIDAASAWATLLVLQKLYADSLDAYSRVFELVPELAWLGSTTGYRYEVIAQISNVLVQAVSVATRLGRPAQALEWLEEGRSIVWNQLLRLRTPLDELSKVDASLVEELGRLARSLENASYPAPDSGGGNLSRWVPEEGTQRHRLEAEKWEQLVARARSLPGMHDFLRPKKAEELVAAARAGPIVIVNVDETMGCVGLIIRPESSEITSLIFSSFTYEKAVKARSALSCPGQRQGHVDRKFTNRRPEGDDSYETMLSMLWTDIAEPILDHLGYKNALPASELPHITWCTTGPLSFLPLHAAGNYSKQGCSLSNYAISSFTPTVSALLAPEVDPASFFGMAIVGQASTPGFTPLPGTVTELDQISKQTGSMRLTRLEGGQATVSSVSAALEDHSWVHFACHASQNSTNPTESAFHLHDGPLNLKSISKKQLKHADLAFLSACQTATGDRELSEEAVHLAASMIMVGYRTVIATMWPINDQDAPVVAERFYAYMLDDQMPKESKAARALHYAVGCLRAKIGEKEFKRWAPYIHIGL
ncbi:hypothetical protein FRC10_004059 [Ceratobasidium sp. 414]|nr:hypothetical protein FRC10_004059 [Ceratobasidium sp. 414]